MRRSFLFLFIIAMIFFSLASAQRGSILIETSESGFGNDMDGFSSYSSSMDSQPGYDYPNIPSEYDQQSSDSLMMYQEFYDMGPGIQDSSGPVQFNIYEAEPSYLIVNGQSRPYDPYYVTANSFWIQGRTSWTQYIQCPMNAWFRMLAFSDGGPAKVVEIYPNGYPLVNQYMFYPGYTQLLFEADAVGRHTLTFYTNYGKSNSVVVDVLPYGGSSPGYGITY
ncbi:MAG: hypothetical protein MUO26_10700 [Methanotrichaceae archaeon]|nr:hypothetical protein [Methanotrichaceae archaeon]